VAQVQGDGGGGVSNMLVAVHGIMCTVTPPNNKNADSYGYGNVALDKSRGGQAGV
jgi:hypothetical protein